MAITLIGAGGLFTRLGQLAGLINAINTFRGGNSAGQLVKEVNDCLAQVDGDTDAIRATLAPLATGYPGAQGSLSSFATAVRSAAQALLIAQANADTPLASLDVADALALLKTQMLASGDYVSPNTLGATVTPAGGNFGNGAIVVGTLDPTGDGLDNLLAETVNVSVGSTASAGGETLAFAGAAAVGDALNQAWPGGSGANKNLKSLDAAAANNLVPGGAFDTFAANVPASWTVVAGAAGTQILQATGGAVYKGASALKYVGDAATLTQIAQNLANLKSRTPYAINLWCKVDVAPAGGTLIVDLYDGAAVINDDAGNANSLSINLATLGTSYVAKGAVFRLPEPVPATVTLRVRLSAALSAGSNLFIDQMAMQAAAQLTSNPGDTPYYAVFSGAANWSLRDLLSIAVTNNRACKWQQAFDQLFDDRASGFLLPTSGSTLINDSLIS